MLPSQAWQAGVADGRWQHDAAQVAALVELDRLHRELLAAQPASWLQRAAAALRTPEPVRGLYLWGRVGRGKTFLVDLLYEGLGELPRQRWHFHRLMGEVHARVRALPDTADTVAVVAREMARDLRLLVLDEFFVGDIGDAMILGRLLDQVFAQGVTLAPSSNPRPRERGRRAHPLRAGRGRSPRAPRPAPPRSPARPPAEWWCSLSGRAGRAGRASQGARGRGTADAGWSA